VILLVRRFEGLRNLPGDRQRPTSCSDLLVWRASRRHDDLISPIVVE
jgi:hypothetical protein